jgi:flagellar motor component MotA
MFAIIGIFMVFGAVIGGFLMEKGHIAVLLQPAELLLIAGAATGTLLVANPLHVLKEIANGLLGVLKGSSLDKERYLNTLKMMYQFLNKVRKEGLLSVEMDVEKPDESSIFKNYPEFLHDHHARDFVCDTLRTAITGGVEPFDMDQMMELDGGASQRRDEARQLTDYDGGLAAGAGHCGRSAGRGHHHGRAGRSAGANRRKGGGRAGGHLLGHLAVLRRGRSPQLQYG